MCQMLQLIMAARCVILFALCFAVGTANTTSTSSAVKLEHLSSGDDPILHSNHLSDACTSVTLNPTQFRRDTVTNDLQVIVGYDQDTIIRNRTVSANESVTVCYPLSPQLLTCNATAVTTQINANNFTIDHQHRLNVHHHDGQNDTVQPLGDYFIDVDGRAVLCRDPVEVPEQHLSSGIPRCNYVTVSSQLSDHLLLIRHPTPESHHGSDTVCYPLAVSYLNCPVKVVLEQSHYQRSGHLLRNMLDNKMVDPANYFLMDVDRAVVCFDEPDYSDDRRIEDVFFGLNILSALCLLLAVAYHATHPKKNYTTKCHISYSISMFVVYVARSLYKLVPILDVSSCYVLYTLKYLSSLSAFFWLNVLAFDVCRFFCSLQTSKLHCFSVRTKVESRFWHYSIFAWCMPLLLYACSMAVDKMADLQRIFGLHPAIDSQCWFNERPSLWAFYYGPLAVLMALNVIYFIITVLNLHHASRGTEAVNGHRFKQLFKISLKLFLVMGLCWISEILTFVFTYSRQFNFYWYISSILTGLQGAAICLIYIIRRRNILHVKSHLCPGRKPPSRGTTWSSYQGNSKVAVTKSDSRLSVVTTISATSLPEDPGCDVANEDQAPPDYETVEKSDNEMIT